MEQYQATHRVGHVPGLKIAKTAQNHPMPTLRKSRIK